MAGLCIAHELARRGRRVLVFEDPSSPTASSVAAGLLQVAGGRISIKHLQLRQACWNAYPKFLQRLNLPFERKTHVRLAKSLDSAQGFASTLRGLGVEVQAQSADELEQRFSLTTPHSGATSEAASVDPRSLLSTLRQDLNSRGVEWLFRSIVSVRTGEAVDSEGMSHKARGIFLACGAGLARLWRPGWELQLESGAGASFRGEHRLAVSVEKPWSGQLFVPSEGGWRGHGNTEELVGLAGERLWEQSAQRAHPPDGLPIVGELSSGVYVLGGLGRNGLLTAPYLAQAVVKMNQDGETPSWLEGFAPDRPGIGFKRAWSRQARE